MLSLNWKKRPVFRNIIGFILLTHHSSLAAVGLPVRSVKDDAGHMETALFPHWKQRGGLFNVSM